MIGLGWNQTAGIFIDSTSLADWVDCHLTKTGFLMN